MNTLHMVASNARPRRSRRPGIEDMTHDSLHSAVSSGLTVGRRVRLGVVVGEVIGYNIACFGQFVGATYPLLVKTELGFVKCGLDEVAPI